MTSPLFIFLVLVVVVILSDYLLKFSFIQKLGSAITAIILTAILANLNVIPSSSNPVYDFIFDYLAPAAIFLLLLDVNLRELKKVGLPMILLFLAGSIGTTFGVIIATFFVHDNPLFDGTYNAIAGMIAGTYTGGSINFNAVALHYNVMQKGMVYGSTIAVDNIITVIWMFATISLPMVLNKLHGTLRKKQASQSKVEIKTKQESINITSIAVLTGLTVFAIWASVIISEWLGTIGLNIPEIVIITTLALIIAQIPAVTALQGNKSIGAWMVYMFLAVIGAYCDFSSLMDAGKLSLLILLFVLIVITVHAGFMYIAGRFMKSDWEEVAIASQANIGGATTALALAQNFGRSELILPAIIIGSLGNAIGTYIGFAVAYFI